MLMERGWAFTLQSTIVMPYLGTTPYDEALENGWLRFSPGEWERWDVSEPVLKSVNLSPEEVKRLCDETYRLFISPRYVLNRLLSIKSFSDLKFSIIEARKILGHVNDFK